MLCGCRQNTGSPPSVGYMNDGMRYDLTVLPVLQNAFERVEISIMETMKSDSNLNFTVTLKPAKLNKPIFHENIANVQCS